MLRYLRRAYRRVALFLLKGIFVTEAEFNAKLDTVFAQVGKLGTDLQTEIDAIKAQTPGIPQSSVDKLTTIADALQALDASIINNTPVSPPAP